MRPIQYATQELVRAFEARTVLTREQVKAALGTPVKMTALRKLRELDYHSSYSHAGRYYTLERLARWDGHGLWTYKGIRFSRHGTLVETIAQLVDTSSGGWVATQLEDVLGVRVQAALLTLYRRGRVLRHQIGGEYLYVSVTPRGRASGAPPGAAAGRSGPAHGRGSGAGHASPPAGLSGDPQRKAATPVCRVRVVAPRSRRRLHRRGLDRAQSQDRGSGTPGIAGRWRLHGSCAGGGSRATGVKKKLMNRIEALLVDDTAGDPMTGLKWTRKSTRSVSQALAAQGLAASPNTVAACLKQLDFSLQRNRKSIGETHHPQRDQQFRQLSSIKADFLDRGQPVISVDSKKRELVGLFLNPGQTWCLLAREVLTHDFRSQSFGVALPYGIYDLLINAGTVVVGTSHDTAEFAVDAIETWLTTYGWFHHPHMTELLVLCDSGGSNGARNLLWKYCLYQRLAQAYGLSITVCHYPSGASKWNPIDHRLFSFISLNWAGVPLESYELILKYIRTTTTTTGLTIDATLNRKRYDTGKKIKPQLSEQIDIQHNSILPQWNYTIRPSLTTCANPN